MSALSKLANPNLALAAYREWLPGQPLARATGRAYQENVASFCAYLEAHPLHSGNPLVDAHARDYAVRDFKSFLLKDKKLKPASVNLALAALDHFYRFLGLDRPRVQREELSIQKPQALEPAEQKELLRAIARHKSARDRAVALLLLYTGLRIGELCALNKTDAPYSERKGLVIVRAGKGSRYREIPLNSPVRLALSDWESERKTRYARFGEASQPALFLDRQGKRLSRRAVDLLLRRIGREAGVSFSAHTLRHTCLTNLVRAGNDLVLVAEIAGHKRLETTRRYSLPSLKDREKALEELKMEY